MREFVKKFNYIFSRREQLCFIGLVALMIIGSAMETGVIYLMLPFVTAITDMDNISNSPIMVLIYETFNLKDVKQLVVFFAILIAIVYIIKSIFQYYVSKLKYRYIAEERSLISGRTFNCLMHKPYYYHVQTNTAAIQKIAVQDIDRMFGLINAIFTTVSSVFTGAMILAVLLVMDVKLTIVSLVLVIIIMGLVNTVVIKKVTAAGKENSIHYMEQIKWINQATGGLKGIYANRKQDLFVHKYTESARAFAHVTSAFQILSELPRRVVEGTCMSGIFIIAAFIITVEEDFLSMLPIFATFAMAAYRLIPITNAMNESMNVIRFHSISLDSVYRVLIQYDTAVSEKKVCIKDNSSKVFEETLKKGVFLEHINFCFEDTEEYLYRDFTMKIPAKKSVAIIGTTGAGKTTLADIILGLQIPQSGKILADDVDIIDNKDWWADRIGYIPQQIYLCDDTIRSNVAFAIPEEDVNDSRILECLDKAQIKKFVEELPKGLDTIVGENGIRLSGGQRQRIGIARALYNDPTFLVMDEATSALDNDTEAAIITAINQLSGDKTLLIIAHRLTTIKDCDIIYRIENGKVVIEKGLGLLK